MLPKVNHTCEFHKKPILYTVGEGWLCKGDKAPSVRSETSRHYRAAKGLTMKRNIPTMKEKKQEWTAFADLAMSPGKRLGGTKSVNKYILGPK